MLASAIVTILFGQTEIDQEDFVTVATDAHEKVIWLDVAVNEVLVVNKLNATYHLIGEHKYCLHSKTARAKVEKIFERWSEQVHDQYVVVLLLAKPANVWYADAALKNFVELALVEQLRMSGFY